VCVCVCVCVCVFVCGALVRVQAQGRSAKFGRLEGEWNLNDAVIKIGQVLLAFDSIFSQRFHIIWCKIFASAL
jgi:hypothetical protein